MNNLREHKTFSNKKFRDDLLMPTYDNNSSFYFILFYWVLWLGRDGGGGDR